MSDRDYASIASAASIEHVEHHAALSSTNDYARQRATELPTHERLLVIADEQTAGRGRGSNRWWTGDGSLAFSLLFDPAEARIAPRHRAMVALAAAVAIVEALEPLLPGRVPGIHWPNDVYVDERKIAGILVEALADGRQIVGIGINVNNPMAAAPSELQSIVTSLVDLIGRPFDRSILLLEFCLGLDRNLATLATEPDLLGRRANSLCLQHGRILTIDTGGAHHTGTCIGIADDGALLLETAHRREAFYSGVLIK